MIHDHELLQTPLTEIEKAQLSTICQIYLTPIGMMQLRRLLFSDGIAEDERDQLKAKLEASEAAVAAILAKCQEYTDGLWDRGYECAAGEIMHIIDRCNDAAKKTNRPQTP